MTAILLLALLAGDDKAATDALEKFKTECRPRADAKVKAIEELSQVQATRSRPSSPRSSGRGEGRHRGRQGPGDRTEEKEKKKARRPSAPSSSPTKFPDVQAANPEAEAGRGGGPRPTS
jgi:hypothetical protein